MGVLTKIPLLPGVFKDETPLSAEGFSVDANHMRFVRARPQTKGGFERASDDLVLGLCRWLHTWRDSSALSYCAIGTHTHLQVYHDAQIYDATPIVSRPRLTNPISTTNASAVVTIAHTSHGRAQGDRVSFSGASAVGGITISGEYTVTEVTSANAYTITHGSAATSTAGPGGGTVDALYYLPVGLADGLAGTGYGTGAWGIGDIGEALEAIYYPRTWSGGEWGPNILASPRGGGIYEWRPNFTATELVTNGTFASDTVWTKGTDWTIGAGVATAAAGVASDLEQNITLAANAYCLLEFDITRSAGTLTVNRGSTAITSAISASAHVKQVFYSGAGGSQALKFSKDSSFAGTIDNVTVTQLTTAQIVPNAPTENTFVLVTPEMQVMTFGTIDLNTGVFNPMAIRSSDTGDGDRSANQTWTPTASNLARQWVLAKGGRIVGARLGVGEILVWTDTSLYRGVYVPDGRKVYIWTHVADLCGLIGPNAVAMLGGIARWITPAAKFAIYDGVSASPLDCPMGKDFADNLAPSQQDKIVGRSLFGFGEADFFYPDIRDGNENSRYLSQKVAPANDPGVGSWAPGELARTAVADVGALRFPLSVSPTTDYLYFDEKGNSADGGPLAWSRTSGIIPIGNGNTLFEIQSFYPNGDDWLGGYQLTVRTANEPNGPFTSYGPYAVATNATKVDLGPVFPIGKFAQFIKDGESAPAFIREGVDQISVNDTGMVF